MGNRRNRRRSKVDAQRTADNLTDRTTAHSVIVDDNATVLSRALWSIAGLFVFWSCGFATLRASDLWWHLAAGRWIVTHCLFPAQDPFSFTAHHRWVLDAWLSDVLLYQWTHSFGVYSLVYWKWIVVVATCFLLVNVCRWISCERASAYLAVMFAAVVAAPFLDIRPHLFSLLFLVLLFFLVLHPEPLRRSRLLLVLSLFLVWANLHPGFILGLAVLPVLLARRYFRPAERRMAITVTAGACLVTLANPAGINVYTQPLIYALRPDDSFRSIGEWLPPFTSGGIVSPLYPVALVLFAASAVVLLLRRERATFLPIIGVATLTMVMSLLSRRLIPAFALCQAITLAAAIAPFSKRWLRKAPFFALPAALTVVGGLVLLRYPLQPRAFHHLSAEYTFPVESVNFIETNGLTGNIFAYYNWGGYLHWRMPGQMKVFIDGRASAVFDEATYRDYLTVMSMRRGWESIIERPSVEYVLWPIAAAPISRSLVQSGRWRFLYKDAVSILLVRADTSLPPLHETPDSPYRDLALGVSAVDRKALSEAEAYFRRALAEMPYLEPACSDLAIVKMREGMPAEADKVLVRCDTIFPDRGRRQRATQRVPR